MLEFGVGARQFGERLFAGNVIAFDRSFGQPPFEFGIRARKLGIGAREARSASVARGGASPAFRDDDKPCAQNTPGVPTYDNVPKRRPR
jgi:hypothetical protein